jgi:hypothetical protein
MLFIYEILRSNSTSGTSQPLFLYFCSDPAPHGPWPEIAALSHALGGSFYPSPLRIRSGPVSASSLSVFSEITANMQNLLNPYLSNHNSKYKVFYMKFYQKNV